MQNESRCNCVFCKSKCPQCHSSNVSVELKIFYGYENDTISEIMVELMGDELQMRCNECGGLFNDMNNKCVKALLDRLVLTLNPPAFVQIEEHNNGNQHITTHIPVSLEERVGAKFRRISVD